MWYLVAECVGPGLTEALSLDDLLKQCKLQGHQGISDVPPSQVKNNQPCLRVRGQTSQLVQF